MQRVFILGSCVSRDAFGDRSAAAFTIDGYVARSSLASALESQPMAGVALDTIESAFQRRMVDLDVNKRLESLLLGCRADVILVDPIDERFDLYEEHDGSVCTVSSELLSSGFRCDPAHGKLIRSGSQGFFERWERGWSRLVALAKQAGWLHRVRVNQVMWSTVLEDGSALPPSFPAERIDAANRFLQRLYLRMAEDLEAGQFICAVPQLASLHHRWGRSPFHYIGHFYDSLIESLSRSLRPASDRCDSTLLSLARLPLSSTMRWYDVSASHGAALSLEVDVICPAATSDRRALVSIDCAEPGGQPFLPQGFMVSAVPGVGTYRYLLTGPGERRTNFAFRLPAGCTSFRIGLRDWLPEGALMLSSLRLVVLGAGPRDCFNRTRKSEGIDQ